MTFDTTEKSVAAGIPAELYRFTRAGGVVAGPLVVAEQWDYASQAARNLVWIKQTSQAAAFDGGDLGGFGGDDLHIGVAYGGGIGGGSGYARHTRTFGPDDGLEQNTTYTVTVPVTLNRAPGFEDLGVIVNSGTSGGGDGALPTGLSGDVVETVTTDANGYLTIRVGHFDLEFGMTGIVILIGTILIEGAAPASSDEESVTYTSADEPIVYSGDTYLPAIITRETLETGGTETGSSDLRVTLPRDHEVAQWFAPGGPERPINLTLYRVHRSDLTAAITPLVARVMRAEFTGNQCVLSCAPLSLRLLERTIPRQRFSRGCNHVLYGTECQAVKALHTLQQVSVLAISADRLTVTIAGVGDYADAITVPQPFAGGYVAAASGPARRILSQVVDDVTLVAPIPGLAVGDLVDVVEGCAHNETACDDQFDNLKHYGGFLGIPIRNPFSDDGRGLA